MTLWDHTPLDDASRSARDAELLRQLTRRGPFARATKDEFFAYLRAHPEQRYELEDGLIVQQMTGGTRRHHSVADNVTFELRQQLDRSAFTVLREFGVETGNTVRFPDVVVEPAVAPNDETTSTQPLVIVEVLSKDSLARDLVIKRAEYLSLASLQAYVVFAQTQPAATLWQRGADGSWPEGPTELRGLEAEIELRTPAARLVFADIYRGFPAPDQEPISHG